METDAHGWSSLPADLVNRVADCILADNDLDYYMDMRAVCHGWRSSTADPKASHDARFHPTRWIVLDELSSESDTRLFVNATTGRFLRRRLPLLRNYHFVTSTTSGFLVLAEKEPPHAARVFNPFTGSMIRFRAPMPSELHMAADVVGDSPTLVIYNLSDELRFFHADPESEQFFVWLDTEPAPGSVEPAPPLQSDTNAGSEVSLGPIIASSFLVLSGPGVKLASGEMLLVNRSPQQGVHLYRMTMERVDSIGGLALFVGTRCMFVHADSFPSINANCIYYEKVQEDGSSGTYVYDLAHDKEERIHESSICIYPASILQLFVEYTMCSPRYKPAWVQLGQKMKDIFLIEKMKMQLAQMIVDEI